MTATKNTDDRQATVDAVAAFMGRAMAHLIEYRGLPPELVAAGAHVAAVTALAQAVGGPMAAACCERAAERVRREPSAAVLRLAMAVPAGTA